jgi:phosphatidylglycerophosphate synthase
MRKISNEKENPIDILLIGLCEKVCEGFHRTGHTPNMITTYSLVCGLLAIRAIRLKQAWVFAIWMSLSYFFDCLDGFMARKYNEMSVLGDYYDHIKDNLVTLGIFYVIFKNYRTHINNRYFIILFAVLFLGMVTHFGCQQHYVIKNAMKEVKETLDYTKPFCRDPKHIKYTRFFGSGTFMLCLIIFVVYIIRKDKLIA